MLIYNDNELCHYGVKGMKWGVRHTKKQKKKHLKGKNSQTKKINIPIGKKYTLEIYKKTLTGKDYVKAGLGALALTYAASPIIKRMASALTKKWVYEKLKDMFDDLADIVDAVSTTPRINDPDTINIDWMYDNDDDYY